MTTLIRWQTRPDLATLNRQLGYPNKGTAAQRLMAELVTRSERPWTPAIEVQSTAAAVMLRVELPGMTAESLDVQVSRNAVAISGERTPVADTPEGGYSRSEFRYGKFQRIIPLAVAIQQDHVQADFQNGILTLTLPRLQAVTPSVVKLNLTPVATEAVTEAVATNHPAESDSTPQPEPNADLGDAWQ